MPTKAMSPRRKKLSDKLEQICQRFNAWGHEEREERLLEIAQEINKVGHEIRKDNAIGKKAKPRVGRG
jgi:hypothetical protein